MINLKLTGADPAPGYSSPEGGAIRSEGILTLRRMVIRESGAGFGAGVYVAVAGGGAGERTVLLIDNSAIEHNSAWQHGGGVYVRFSSATNGQDRVRVETFSSLSNNIAGPGEIYPGRGGALYISNGSGSNSIHAVTITRSTLNTNTADIGGAVYHASNSNARVDLSILELSAISGNTATNGDGGGVYSRAYGGAQIRVDATTISGNTSYTSGGGLWARLRDTSSLVIEKSQISGNTATNGDGGGVSARLYSAASLQIANSTVSANTAGSDGGGVYAVAPRNYSDPFPTPRAVTITRTVISGNTATRRGGGLFALNYDGTETLVEESRISGNHVPNSYAGGARGNGGGIYAYVYGNPSGTNSPKWTITRSTVDNNDAEHEGGGIFVCGKFFGNFIATNTTISANRTTNQTTGVGGGIFIARYPYGVNESIDAYLRNVTVTQNTSATGGGVGMANLDNVRVRIANSLVSQNFDHQSAPNNLDGRVMVGDFKHNLVGTGSTILDHATGQVVYQDQPAINTIPAGNNNILGTVADSPFLGALSNNGGPTPTHSLLAGSPAIDKGSNALASDPLTAVAFTTDQRGAGFTRPWDITSVVNGPGGAVDIGAYEIGLPKVIEVIVSDSVPAAHTPYSFANAVGSGEQLRTVPVGGANRLQIRFSEAVTVGGAPVTVQSALTSTFYTGTVAYSDNVITWTTLNGIPIHRDQLILRIDDAAVTGLGGQLDGDWINPSWLGEMGTNKFPSGNGTAGGDFVFRFTILSADFTHDNIVSTLDYVVWSKFYYTPSGAQHWQGDANGDGKVDPTDYGYWSWEFGINFTQWPA